MIKDFYYEGSTIIGYKLRLVKDKKKKNKEIFDSNISKKNMQVKSYSKIRNFKGKR